MSAKPKWCVTWFMYFWIFFSEDITAKFHHWRSCVTWRPFCDQSAGPSWIGLRFLLWIILCIEEYEGISANTSCDSVACVSCIITREACLDWVDLDGAAVTACFTSILLGKAHENALQSRKLDYLQYDLYLRTFFTMHLQDSVSLHTTLSKR